MADTAAFYLFVLVGPLLLKAVGFALRCQWWKHRVQLITCVLCAGAPMLLALLLVPLPPMSAIVVSMGIALAVLVSFTEVPVVPEGLLLLVGTEMIARLAMARLSRSDEPSALQFPLLFCTIVHTW